MSQVFSCCFCMLLYNITVYARGITIRFKRLHKNNHKSRHFVEIFHNVDKMTFVVWIQYCKALFILNFSVLYWKNNLPNRVFDILYKYSCIVLSWQLERLLSIKGLDLVANKMWIISWKYPSVHLITCPVIVNSNIIWI